MGTTAAFFRPLLRHLFSGKGLDSRPRMQEAADWTIVTTAHENLDVGTPIAGYRTIQRPSVFSPTIVTMKRGEMERDTAID